jgi:hypothetical protein
MRSIERRFGCGRFDGRSEKGSVEEVSKDGTETRDKGSAHLKKKDCRGSSCSGAGGRPSVEGLQLTRINIDDGRVYLYL